MDVSRTLTSAHPRIARHVCFTYARMLERERSHDPIRRVEMFDTSTPVNERHVTADRNFRVIVCSFSHN
jgi:hypothetical protein